MKGRSTFEDLDRLAFFLHYYYQQVKMVRFTENGEDAREMEGFRLGELWEK